jgi:hypothetical protein
VTGSLLVFDDESGTWRRVWTLPSAYVLLNKCPMPGFHMITKEGSFLMLEKDNDRLAQNNKYILVRDSLETTNCDLNNAIDTLLLSSIHRDGSIEPDLSRDDVFHE